MPFISQKENIRREVLLELRQFDTPTICNALELIDSERRNYGYTSESLLCMYPSMKPIVGLAKTATMRSFRPSAKSSQELKQERVEYYSYVSEGSLSKIVVMQDLDGIHRAHGPFWGEFNSRVHKAIGCEGVVTDGSVRDVPNLPNDFQILASCIKPSHANVHIVDYGIQVNVCSMVVEPNSVVHMDMHGAVTFPVDIACEVVNKAKEFIESERPVIQACKDKESLTIDELVALYLQR